MSTSSLRRPTTGVGARAALVVVHRVRFGLLRLRSPGRIRAAAPPTVSRGVRLMSPARLTIGDRVALGRDLYIETDLTIGDDVLFAGRVSVVGNTHPIDTPGAVTGPYIGPPQPVRLDGDNLVGEHATLIGPCHLERGAIVGAGAVATGLLRADTIYVGVPARPLRRRDRERRGD